MSEKTLGQIAYEAFYAGTEAGTPVLWADLTDWDVHWTAAAQAVAAHVANPDAADYDSAAEIMRLHDEIGKHRTRLAMLLADTPFELRPDWEHEYDDVPVPDGTVEIPAEGSDVPDPFGVGAFTGHGPGCGCDDCEGARSDAATDEPTPGPVYGGEA